LPKLHFSAKKLGRTKTNLAINDDADGPMVLMMPVGQKRI
jgi:hypothetical protein